jgi:integrase
MSRKQRGRGEGCIGQQGARWFAFISLGYDGNGKRVRKRVYADSKKEAQEELRKMQDEAARGGVTRSGTMTIGELLGSWLEAMKPAWATGTHASHDQHVRNHLRPRLGGVRLSLVTPLHVQRLMAAMEVDEVSAAMRRHVAVTLRAALGWGVKMKLLSTNPALAVSLPSKPRHQSEGLTPQQIGTFLEAAAGYRLYAMYLVAIDAGLRQGELLALTWKDIDAERGTVRVNKALEEVGGNLAIKAPKTPSSIRMVKLSSATTDALAEHRRAMLAEGHCTADSPVFCGPRSGGWLRKSDIFRHSFAPILKRAGLKFRFHDLRHASASLLLSGGVDVKTVQARLGHSAAAITMDVYAHALDRGQQTAADMMQGLFTPKPKRTGEGAG